MSTRGCCCWFSPHLHFPSQLCYYYFCIGLFWGSDLYTIHENQFHYLRQFCIYLIIVGAFEYFFCFFSRCFLVKFLFRYLRCEWCKFMFWLPKVKLISFQKKEFYFCWYCNNSPQGFIVFIHFLWIDPVKFIIYYIFLHCFLWPGHLYLSYFLCWYPCSLMEPKIPITLITAFCLLISLFAFSFTSPPVSGSRFVLLSRYSSCFIWWSWKCFFFPSWTIDPYLLF